MFRRCGKRKVKSPLHHLENVYGADLDAFETVPSAGRNSALIGMRRFKTVIPPSKEGFKEANAQAPENLKFYTDGSVK